MHLPSTSWFQNLTQEQQVHARKLSQHAQDKIKAIHNFNENAPTSIRGLNSLTTAISLTSTALIKSVREQTKYQQVLSLVQQSIHAKKIHLRLKELYQEIRQQSISELKERKTLVQRKILGPKEQEFRAVKKGTNPNKQMILKRVWEERYNGSTNKKLRTHYDHLDNSIYFLESEVFFSLSDKLFAFRTEAEDMASSIAFVIYCPEILITPSYLLVDEKWEEFPLKWCHHFMSIGDIWYLFEMFKDGEDLSSFYIEIYSNQGVQHILELLQKPFTQIPVNNIFDEFQQAMIEALTCFEQGLYASFIYSVLPVIEGYLWGYAKTLHRANIASIYTDNTCEELLHKTTQNPIPNLTVGSLLRETEFGNFLEAEFIEYFCSELYNERNPVLHGRDFSRATPANAAKKAATLEHLLTASERHFEEILGDFLENSLSDEVADELVAELAKQVAESS